MIRFANEIDALDLKKLNDRFNGISNISIDEIKESLKINKQELVFVYEVNNKVIAFLSMQIKKSFCYEDVICEISELYVEEEYRNQGIATKLIKFSENYALNNYVVQKFELLTGKDNLKAQSLYKKLNYIDDEEMYFSKLIDK